MLNDNIESRFKKIYDEIQSYSIKYRKNSDSVKLIVVTKGHSAAKINQVILAGAQYLGENYPEETATKIKDITVTKSPIEWHMIGHLQSRKSQLIVENFSLLHSLDSIKLARRLNNQLIQGNKYLPVLLQFNVGGEVSKFGWDASNPNSWVSFVDEVHEIAELSHLRLQGLMTMPPFTTDEKEARFNFAKLKELSFFLTSQIPRLQLDEFSMGTSHDYQFAIAEGATMVRIGTAIMGERK